MGGINTKKEDSTGSNRPQANLGFNDPRSPHPQRASPNTRGPSKFKVGDVVYLRNTVGERYIVELGIPEVGPKQNPDQIKRGENRWLLTPDEAKKIEEIISIPDDIDDDHLPDRLAQIDDVLDYQYDRDLSLTRWIVNKVIPSKKGFMYELHRKHVIEDRGAILDILEGVRKIIALYPQTVRNVREEDIMSVEEYNRWDGNLRVAGGKPASKRKRKRKRKCKRKSKTHRPKKRRSRKRKS